MAKSLLVDHNCVSGICKLKPKKNFKNLKTYIFLPALRRAWANM